MKNRTRSLRRWPAVAVSAVLLLGFVVMGPAAADEEPLDPAFNVALPCEAISTPGLVPRSAKNLAHVANVCGFVGTDIEFQSRKDAAGVVHDYAFVGTLGGGTRIFDITDPAHPTAAGGYLDPGWQNDVQVRGDLLVIGFDWLVVGANVSTCLQQKNLADGTAGEAGVDLVRLSFDPQTATFTTSLLGCYVSSIRTGGAHTTTIHPSGEWLTVNTSFAGLEVVDIRQPATPRLVHTVGTAVVDEAHDVSFSRDGNTLYSAGIASTRIVDVTNVFGRAPTLIGTAPNAPTAAQGADGQVVAISHQADVSSDGQILVVTDEAGGGLSETRCNEGSSGKIGGAHFWSVADPANPRKLGTWVYPNPVLLIDALGPALTAIGRTERACTIHVFRNGGNGSAGPGPIAAGYDGVSSLPKRQLVTAHYGAGTWWLDFSAASSSTDGIAEDPRATWGKTLGWNVMPGADTWSAKEYKGYIYTGDMTRGMDVFSFTSCDGVGCVVRPTNTPGSASGGGQLVGELAEFTITRGTAVGGRAQFSLDVAYVLGAATPTGTVHFRDRDTGRRVDATAIDSLTIAGATATITGRATVNGTPGVAFFAEVEDLGKAGADTFRIVTGDGYGAFGVVDKGNITVQGGLAVL
ncbi:MAG TPA: post-COAP-1 domain-containing protein [Vitreimonas sp.]|nr:post-COAP-1 domain-containing protein [Vitreimonas sp.]